MMNKTNAGFSKFRGIAFIGNYLPRHCGIATFTYDLAEAVAAQAGERQPVSVCAMNDIPEGYDYPDRVKFEIRQEHPIDYVRAADFLNLSNIDVVNLQHEFGIFGGEWGSNILTVLKDLRWPLVVTCHTVLRDPLPIQKEIFQEIAARARKMVVMSKKAVHFMTSAYKIDPDKIVMIPHGIHDMPFIDPSYFKDKFGVEGRKVLLSFGLLNRNKGIETMIEALPEIVKKHPKVTYVVLGATHPAVIRMEGESYRLELQRRVRELEIEKHVLFHSRFVELDELLEYLGASDILVTPYRALDQITSGALSYAMGTGKAVVSTPYWHAEELLDEGRGRFIPVGDSKELAKQIIDLLDDEVALSTMRKRAYMHCRNMIWPMVARQYLELYDEVRSRMSTIPLMASAMSRPISVSIIPTPKLNHLIRLSNNTGPSHHALRGMPDWTWGYWLKDAASALVAAAKFYDIFGTDNAANLVERYLSLIHYMLESQDAPIGRMTYAKEPVAPATETDLGQALWALGYAVSHGPPLSASSANDIFNWMVPDTKLKGLRGMAYAILSASNYLLRFPGASAIRRYMTNYSKILSKMLDEPGWLDRWEGSDFGVPVQALAVASRVAKSKSLKEQADRLIEELLKETANGTLFLKRGENPDEEELPIIPMSFIEALGAQYTATKNRKLLDPLRSAVDWFLGSNRRNEALYDFNSGGCYDALTATGINQNQGTEATVSCLISFLTLYDLAGTEREINSNG